MCRLVVLGSIRHVTFAAQLIQHLFIVHDALLETPSSAAVASKLFCATSYSSRVRDLHFSKQPRHFVHHGGALPLVEGRRITNERWEP